MEPFPYRIERLNEDRLKDVQQLFAEVRKKKVSLEYLHRKYDTRYTGVHFLGAMAYDGNRPISFHGAIPQVVTHPDGTRMIVGHAADAMTLEAYRRKGIHHHLALQLYDWMREADVKVLYGFLNEYTSHACEKLGWTKWGNLRGYAVTATRWPIHKLVRRIPLLSNFQAQRLKREFTRYNLDAGVFSNSSNSLGWAVEYAPEFYASRSFHQNFLVQMDGVKFWLATDAVVRVGDVHFESFEQFDTALERLRTLCGKLGYGQILFQTYPDSRVDEALSRHFTRFESWIVGYLELFPDVDFRAYRPNYADQDSF